MRRLPIQLLLLLAIGATAQQALGQVPDLNLPPRVLPPPVFGKEVAAAEVPFRPESGRSRFTPTPLPADVLQRFGHAGVANELGDATTPGESGVSRVSADAPLPFANPNDVLSPPPREAIPLPPSNGEIRSADVRALRSVAVSSYSEPIAGRRQGGVSSDLFDTLAGGQAAAEQPARPLETPTAADKNAQSPSRSASTRPAKQPAYLPVWPQQKKASIWDRKLPAHPAAQGLPALDGGRPPAAEQPNPFVDDPAAEEVNAPVPPIGSLSVAVAPPMGRMPDDRAARYFDHEEVYLEGRAIPLEPVGVSYHWVAPGSTHNPLYFEDVNLERYGYSHGILQPAISAAHFFGTLPALPYLMAANHPHECNYTLGHYRPGSCVPLRHHRWPLSLRGAIAEGGIATGLVFLIP